MYDSGKIITGLIIFVVLALSPVLYQKLVKGEESVPPEPILTETAKNAQDPETHEGGCVESKDFMTTQHMKLLDQWRHEVVRDGERYYTNSDGKEYYKSLQVTCMDCHYNKTDFCDRCHNYMGVEPFCWDCHIAPKEYK